MGWQSLFENKTNNNKRKTQHKQRTHTQKQTYKKTTKQTHKQPYHHHWKIKITNPQNTELLSHNSTGWKSMHDLKIKNITSQDVLKLFSFFLNRNLRMLSYLENLIRRDLANVHIIIIMINLNIFIFLEFIRAKKLAALQHKPIYIK